MAVCLRPVTATSQLHRLGPLTVEIPPSLRTEVKRLRTEVKRLRTEVKRLRTEAKRLRTEVNHLRTKAGGKSRDTLSPPRRTDDRLLRFQRTNVIQ